MIISEAMGRILILVRARKQPVQLSQDCTSLLMGELLPDCYFYGRLFITCLFRCPG